MLSRDSGFLDLRLWPAILYMVCAFGQFAPAHGQASAAPVPEQPGKSSTFRAESRLVVVDVVVTKHREPVTGLTQSDFQVLEDGKRQQIQFFEAHVPSTSTEKVVLPEHQYSNLSDETPSSINIVLFDLLNTPLIDQPYAREQMVQFLKTLPPGRQVALFELGGSLRMLAGFRATSDELLAAAKKVVPHRSAFLDTQESREDAQDQIALARDGSMNQEFFDRMADFLAETTAGRDQDRAKITLQALNDISHAVSGFRGRKNLIWLSEEFPVYFGPQMNAFRSQRKRAQLFRGHARYCRAAFFCPDFNLSNRRSRPHQRPDNCKLQRGRPQQ